MAPEFETILAERGDDHVLTVTLNRPAAMNAFNLAMMKDFSSLWRYAIQDDDVHAIVLRAAKGRAFSTGVDVRAGDNVMGSDNIWSQTDPGESLSPKHNRCWKPIVTAVHGLAAGGAFYWINESDIIICSEDAQFFDPHVTFGMTAALEPIGMTYRAPLGDVLRMALLGNDERISAQTALRIGLVTEVVPEDALWDRAHALAALIAAKPPAATQGTVRAIWESLDQGRSAALQRGLSYCQIGNAIGIAQVDRNAVMGHKQPFSLR